MNKKKKPFLPIAVAIAVVLAAGAGGTAYYLHQKSAREAYKAQLAAEMEAERQRQEKIQSYLSKSVELYDAIEEVKPNFNILSTMYNTSTEINTGTLGPSFYTSFTEGLCSEEITEEKSRRRHIDEIYKELEELECTEDEIQALKSTIGDFYYAYCDRYELLIDMDFSTTNFSMKDSSSQSDFDEKSSAAYKEIYDLKQDVMESVEDTEDAF